MEKQGLKKAIIAGAVAALVLAGGAAAAAGYLSGSRFVPSAKAPELKTNQVVFTDEAKTTGNSDNPDESELWQKDDSAEDQNRPQSNDSADYLFEDNRRADLPGAMNGALNIGSNTPSAAAPGSAAADVVYDITGNAAAADTVISGNTAAGTGEADSANGGSSNGNGGSGNSANAGSNAGGSTVLPTPTPAAPEPVQPDPKPEEINAAQNDAWPGIRNPPTTDDNKGNSIFLPSAPVSDTVDLSKYGKDDLKVMPPFGGEQDSLYVGQTVSARDLYDLLTFFVKDEENNVAYYLTSDHYNKLVRITGVSFDDGVTWIEEFPLTIQNVDTWTGIAIRYEYRFSTQTDWKDAYTGTAYAFPSNSSTYVLSQKLSAAQTTIDRSNILNISSRYDDNLLLYNYVAKLLLPSETRPTGIKLDKLFPGWEENGVLQPFVYMPTQGRHILEPADGVPYDTEHLQVELRGYYVDLYTGQVEPVADGNGLSYLQTLTHYSFSAGEGGDYNNPYNTQYLENLDVPYYVQAVDFLYSTPLTVGTLKIPATVLYVNTEGLQGIGEFGELGYQVANAYEVDAENPAYTARDGILYSKDETEILGVPVGKTELVVPDTVTKVVLPQGTRINTLTLQAEDIDALPDIDYSKLATDSKIIVPDNVLEDFLVANKATLDANRLVVEKQNDPNTQYTVHGEFALDQNSGLHYLLEKKATWVTLDDTISALRAGSMATAPYMSDLALSANVTPKFDSGWLQDVDSLTIHCTKEQKDAVLAAIRSEKRENDPKIKVVVQGDTVAANGYTYTVEKDGDNVTDILLTAVPDTITEFDGTVPAGENSGDKLNVTVIAQGALQNKESLRWVTLTDSIKVIGKDAFKGCTALEGVLIGTSSKKLGSVTIRTGAFDNCPALRFVASNAYYGNVEDDEFALTSGRADKAIWGQSVLYAPTNNVGYTDKWIAFDEGSNIDYFTLEDCGGTKVLYGNTEERTKDPDNETSMAKPADLAWIALRSGGIIDNDVNLPVTTRQIYQFCFMDSHKEEGFTVNFSNLPELYSVGTCAFALSDIGKDIDLPDCTYEEAAFSYCNTLENVRFYQQNTYAGKLNLQKVLFSECENLKTVTFSPFERETGVIALGSFYGCNNLTTLTFTDTTSAPQFFNLTNGYKFYFNTEVWANGKNEADNLRLSVPQGYANVYLQKWHYGFAGYSSEYDIYAGDMVSAFQVMWQDTRAELQIEEGNITDAAANRIFAKIDEKLLDAENTLRSMMGLSTITRPEDVFHTTRWTLQDDGMIALTQVTDSTDYTISYDNEELELPTYWSLDSIGTRAFANSPNLKKLEWEYPLVSFASEPFAGVQATNEVKLQLINTSNQGSSDGETTIPQLVLSDVGGPYSFGVADENMQLYDAAYFDEVEMIAENYNRSDENGNYVFDAAEFYTACVPVYKEYLEKYINAWILPLAGYNTLDELQQAVTTEVLQEQETTFTAETLHEAVTAGMQEKLLAAENRVRTIVSLESALKDKAEYKLGTITDANDMLYEWSLNEDLLSGEATALMLPDNEQVAVVVDTQESAQPLPDTDADPAVGETEEDAAAPKDETEEEPAGDEPAGEPETEPAEPAETPNTGTADSAPDATLQEPQPGEPGTGGETGEETDPEQPPSEGETGSELPTEETDPAQPAAETQNEAGNQTEQNEIEE